MIPDLDTVPFNVRGPVIVVLVALTSKTLFPHVAVSPFREISFLAIKGAKEHSIVDPKNDTSKLSLNQTLGPDLLLSRISPPALVGDSFIFAALMLMYPSSVILRMSAPVESMMATSPKELVCKLVAPLTYKVPSV